MIELTPWEARIHIYVLRDPETKRVHYVGKSTRPGDRLGNHLCGSPRDVTSPKGQWVQALRARSLKPEMCIVETGSVEDGDELERKWIAFFAGKGEPLLNVANRPRVKTESTELLPEMLTGRQAAIRKGVAESALRKALADGRLVGQRMGTVWMICIEDLDAWHPRRHRTRSEGGGSFATDAAISSGGRFNKPDAG